MTRSNWNAPDRPVVEGHPRGRLMPQRNDSDSRKLLRRLRETLAAPGGDLLDDGLGRRLTQPMGPRGAIEEARSALGLEARAPFVHGLDIDPEVHGHGPGRLAHDQHAADEFGSTMRRQSGILVDVHSVLPWTLKHHNLSFLGQGRMDNLLKAHS